MCESLEAQEGGFQAGVNNEVVVNTTSITANPVEAIAAFVMMGLHDEVPRAARELFIAKYGLSRASAPPLVTLDMDRTPPFELVE